MAKAKRRTYDLKTLDEHNIGIFAELLVSDSTPDSLRIRIINRLMEVKENQSFFQTMFEENISFGKCPSCSHENHFLIPEDALNELGWVTSIKDPLVKEHTTKDDCPKWQESCKKKKVSA
jgi:hypothetical protein